MCGLEDRYNELKEIILHRTAQHFTIDPFSSREMGSYSYGTKAQPLDQHEISVEQNSSRQHY